MVNAKRMKKRAIKAEIKDCLKEIKEWADAGVCTAEFKYVLYEETVKALTKRGFTVTEIKNSLFDEVVGYNVAW